MEEHYQIAVRRNVGSNLKFPSKCAYCLEPSAPHYKIVKHDQLKGYKLKVPYCETHSSMIRYMKLVHYGSFSFALLLTILIGRYLHNHQVFVLGFIGFNYLVAAFVVFIPTWFAAGFILRIMVLRQFAGEGYLEHYGAVEIVGVDVDTFVLLFHNKSFGTEFSQLNYLPPPEKQR